MSPATVSTFSVAIRARRGDVPDLRVSSPFRRAAVDPPASNERDDGLGRAEGDGAGAAALLSSDVAERGAGRGVPERHAVRSRRGERRPVRADAHAARATVGRNGSTAAIATRRPRPSVWPSSGDLAAERPPSGLNASRLDLAAGLQQGRTGRVERPRVQEPNPAVLEADSDQPAVRAELPRMGVRPVDSASVVRERERPPEPPLPAEVPDDRAPVGARRVERLPSGLKTGCQTESECPRSVSRGVSAPASQRVTVPSRLVDTMVLPSGLNCSQIGLAASVPLDARSASPCAGRSAGSRRRGRSPRVRHPG